MHWASHTLAHPRMFSLTSSPLLPQVMGTSRAQFAASYTPNARKRRAQEAVDNHAAWRIRMMGDDGEVEVEEEVEEEPGVSDDAE